MSPARLFLLQRASAALLGPLVLVHLALIVYAVQGGLSAAEILGRTRGSLGWALFYGLFVAAAALHGGIGLRNVIAEWMPAGRALARPLALAFALLALLLGLRAVYAVCLA